MALHEHGFHPFHNRLLNLAAKFSGRVGNVPGQGHLVIVDFRLPLNNVAISGEAYIDPVVLQVQLDLMDLLRKALRQRSHELLHALNGEILPE